MEKVWVLARFEPTIFWPWVDLKANHSQQSMENKTGHLIGESKHKTENIRLVKCHQCDHCMWSMKIGERIPLTITLPIPHLDIYEYLDFLQIELKNFVKFSHPILLFLQVVVNHHRPTLLLDHWFPEWRKRYDTSKAMIMN
jgi:NAD-dependent dihydropyrimidine dehydrogenase PreA subunit